MSNSITKANKKIKIVSVDSIFSLIYISFRPEDHQYRSLVHEAMKENININ